MKRQVRLALVPFYLLLCCVLGGASAAGYLSNFVLQLLGLGILGWSLMVRRKTPMTRSGRFLLLLLTFLCALLLIQIVPLPAVLWEKLPGREPILAGFRLLGEPVPSSTLSLAPYNTVASAIWLLPAMATLMGILKLGHFKPSWIGAAVLAAAAISVPIGAVQLAGSASWYFYKVTNYGAPTGFFSNANHFATLLVVAIPFALATFAAAKKKQRSIKATSGATIILVGALCLIFMGLAMNASLAGLGLTLPVAGASFLLLQSSRSRVKLWQISSLAAVSLACVTLIWSAPSGNNLFGQEARLSPESRYTSFTTSLSAAKAFLPVGSGVGTFAAVYRLYEDPSTVTSTYMNHVHNDYIEILLETGLAGAALLAIFLLWWARQTILIWRDQERDLYACAATIATGAILAHSLVDYPLRTAAISAIFAACCALMTHPRPRVARSRADESGGARHLSA